MGLYDVKTQLLANNANSAASFSTWTPAYGDPCSGWIGVSCTSGQVTGLDLNYKGLVGSLPTSLGLVSSLQSVQLTGNSFSGVLPPSWSTLSRLTLLNVANCLLVGTLPTSWSALTSLAQLNLGSNALTGTIPTSWALPAGMASLTRLVASSNAGLCGPLPGSWTASRVPSSGSLLGSACSQTSGLLSLLSAVTPATWPSGMSGWSNSTDPCAALWTGVTCTGPTVTALDLQFYGMQGTLPASLFSVSGLQTLSLGGNMWVLAVGMSCWKWPFLSLLCLPSIYICFCAFYFDVMHACILGGVLICSRLPASHASLLCLLAVCTAPSPRPGVP